MLYDNLIIDVSNLFWRTTVSVIKKIIQTEDDIDEEREFYSVAIQDSLDRIQLLKKQYGAKECKLYLLYDNPFSKINQREQIYYSYKHARKNKDIPPVFYKCLEKLIEILKVYHNNFYLCNHDGCEADDLVRIILNHKKGTSLLISADMDWSRDISDIDHWFNYQQIYNIETFTQKYGFNPCNNGVKMYKCIHGDTSDSIENAIPYLPNTILCHIANKYNSLEELFSNLWKDDEIPKVWKLKIKDNEIKLKINYQLVDYMDLDLSIDNILYTCVEDIEKLRSWFLILDISFENRMIDAKKDMDCFLERKRFRRYGGI